MNEFKIEIKITEDNINYTSDFKDNETIFWLEAVKNIILKDMAERVFYD